MILVGSVKKKAAQKGMTLVVIDGPMVSFFMLCGPVLAEAFEPGDTYSFSIERSRSDPAKKLRGKKV